MLIVMRKISALHAPPEQLHFCYNSPIVVLIKSGENDDSHIWIEWKIGSILNHTPITLIEQGASVQYFRKSLTAKLNKRNTMGWGDDAVGLP